MVRVLANGELVADDDPRVKTNDRNHSERPQRRQGGITHDDSPSNRRSHGGGPSNPGREPTRNHPSAMGRGEAPDAASIFAGLNGRLTGFGVPTWRVGAYAVEPLASVAFVLSLVFFGLPGLVFAVVVFFIVKLSGEGGGGGLAGLMNRLGLGGNNAPVNPASGRRLGQS